MALMNITLGNNALTQGSATLDLQAYNDNSNICRVIASQSQEDGSEIGAQVDVSLHDLLEAARALLEWNNDGNDYDMEGSV